MDIQKITYDVSRFYLHDERRHLPDAVFKRLIGKIRSRDYQYLATCSTDSTLDVTGVEAFRVVRQIEAFFKKNQAFTDPVPARLAALISFEEGEALCEATNNRLDPFYSYPSAIPKDIRRMIEKMSAFIYELLGPHRDFLEELPKLVKVTAGATATRPRRRSLPFLKVNKRLVCTPGAYPYLAQLSDYYGYGGIQGKLVSENRVTFVPKSWKTERTIACEAEGNTALQLAFDTYAKRRLRRKGVDLSDQTRNQQLAKEGSIHGELATIDLSMASDTLSYNVVALLFPEDWFNYLRSIRSQAYTIYSGSKQQYHKFSSMGNGATFAIETIVFAAACFAVNPSTYSVYGDDIIIDSDRAMDLIALLDFLGFVPNTEKSYLSGPFRESCGKDWYKGIDITPQYLRGLDSRKAMKCHFVNSLMTIADPWGELAAYLSSFIEEHRLPAVPYNESTISGVWIDPHFAYSLGVLKCSTRGKHAWKPRTKAYVARTRSISDVSIRSLFLWHLRASSNSERPLGEPLVSSRYTASSHKYVRKWVHWNPVAMGAPENLYFFSEYFIRKGCFSPS